MHTTILALVLISATGASQYIDTDNLTPQQIAEFQLAIEKKRQENANPTSVENLSKYAELGQNIGVALAATAKEVGVAVNDFSGTTIGKVTIGLIVYKIVGSEIIRKAFALFFFVCGGFVWLRIFRRLCLVESTLYHENGKVKEVRAYSYKDKTDGYYSTQILLGIMAVAICLASILLMLS